MSEPTVILREDGDVIEGLTLEIRVDDMERPDFVTGAKPLRYFVNGQAVNRDDFNSVVRLMDALVRADRKP